MVYSVGVNADIFYFVLADAFEVKQNKNKKKTKKKQKKKNHLLHFFAIF